MSHRRGAFAAAAVVCGVFATLAPVCAQAPVPATLADTLSRKLGAFEKTIGGGARIGLSVTDLGSSKQLAAARENELFIPASNQKLLVSAFALQQLGGGYKFSTELYMTPAGDMVVYGDFDPTLGDPVLAAEDKKPIYAEMDRWIAEVAKRVDKDKKLGGNIFVSAGSGVYRSADWKKTQNHLHYQAPAAKLNFHRNCFAATFKISDGQAVPVIAPHTRFITVKNSLKLGSRHVWSMAPRADDSELHIRGTIKAASPFPLFVAANNPPMLFGRVLAERLVAGGVAFEGRISSLDLSKVDRKGTKPICTTTTPLARAIRRANKDSLNMAAECLLLRGGDGTWSGSGEIMTKTLTKAFALPKGSLVVSDGSGLSRKNRISPAAMTKLLAGIARRKDASVLLDSLARAGVDGTLKKRMTVGPCKGRIAAKTGYILGVSCLSGYVLDKKGKPAIAFSIMANDMPGRVAPAKDLQDSICAMLVAQVDKE